jgi:hypothetical protein
MNRQAPDLKMKMPLPERKKVSYLKNVTTTQVCDLEFDPNVTGRVLHAPLPLPLVLPKLELDNFHVNPARLLEEAQNAL